MAVDTTAFDELKAAVADYKGDELQRWADEHEGGAEGLLNEVFTNMVGAFRPDKAKGQEADFQYHIKSGDKEFWYFISVTGGGCTTGQGEVDSPKVTMTAKLPDFLRLVTGKLNGMQAFLTGKVKIAGNSLYATKFESWFERP